MLDGIRELIEIEGSVVWQIVEHFFMIEHHCVDHVELRGAVYYLRMRVPSEFREIETRIEIDQSLRTRVLKAAQALADLKERGKLACCRQDSVHR